MKLFRQLSLVLLILIALPSLSLGQTINIHFGAKKPKKATAKKETRRKENKVTITGEWDTTAAPLPTTPLRLPAFTSPTVFSSFAPEQADLLVVIRPAELIQYSIVERQYQATAAMMAQIDEQIGASSASIQPPRADEIELVMVAARHAPLIESIGKQSRSAFERVTAELEGREYNPKDEPANVSLTENLSVLVRFNSPTDWSYVKRKLGSKMVAGEKVSLRQWRGHEILASVDNSDPSAVLRLDDRTFLFCDRNRVAERISNPTNEQNDVGRWLTQFGLERSDAAGELYVAAKPDSRIMPFALLSMGEGWESLEHLEEARLSLDVKDDSLLNVDVDFDSAEQAKSFLGQVRNSLSSAKTLLGMSKSHGNDSANGDMAKRVRLGLDSIDGTKVSTTGSTFTLQFVKPDNFEERFLKLTNSGNSRPARFENASQNVNTVKMAPVVIATRRIPTGTRLTKADIKIENWPEELISEDSARDQDSVVGKRTLRPIFRGGPINTSVLEN